MKNRRVIFAALILAAIVVMAALVITQVLPGLTPPQTTGTPAITSQFSGIKTKVKTAVPAAATSSTGTSDLRADNAIKLIVYRDAPAAASLQTQPQQAQFRSCTADRGATATPGSAAPTATTEVPAATATGPAASAPTVEPDFIVLQIIGDESEACYQVGEVFLNENNRFNLAIGVSKAINGEIAIDRANVANSKLGDIVVDISQLRSDESLRDGRIRRQWLESNKFPLAKLTDARLVGLPSKAYRDGELLKFQIVGLLQVRDVKKEITFDTTTSLNGGTLVGSAVATFKMGDFGFEAPSIAGILRADDGVRVIFNFVAREPADSTGTPAK